MYLAPHNNVASFICSELSFPKTQMPEDKCTVSILVVPLMQSRWKEKVIVCAL